MQHGWEHLLPEDEELILRGIKEGRALGGPFHVEIDPVDACNVSCFFCGSADLHHGGVLKWENLSPAVERWISGGLRSFRLAGGGEPLMYADLGKLCDRMAQSDIRLHNLTTNGVLLNRTIDNLMKVKMTHVLVSLNYASPEQYGKFMRTMPSKFDTVVKNIHLLHDRLTAAGRRQETVLQTHFFIHRSTVDDIPQIAEFAKTLPVDQVTIKAIGHIPEEEVIRPDQYDAIRKHLSYAANHLIPDQWLEFDFGLTGQQQFALETLAKARGWTMEQVAPKHDIEYCYIAWHSTSVLGSGNVHACCHLMPHSNIPPLGNLVTQDFDSIWHGPLYTQMRQEMRTVMLMQQKTPGQQRRFKCTMPFCWKHDACGLAYNMASPDFYQRAHEELQELRRRPLMRVARGANSLSRFAIDGTKRLIAR